MDGAYDLQSDTTLIGTSVHPHPYNYPILHHVIVVQSLRSGASFNVHNEHQNTKKKVTVAFTVFDIVFQRLVIFGDFFTILSRFGGSVPTEAFESYSLLTEVEP